MFNRPLDRKTHFFGGLLPQEVIDNPKERREKNSDAEADAIFSEIMWDAAFNTHKVAAEPMVIDDVVFEYFEPITEEEIDRYLVEDLSE